MVGIAGLGKGEHLIFLWLMREGPVYGYELAARFKKCSKGHISVSYGTIYPFLRRMEERGVIRSRSDQGSGRVYYELTPKGRQAVERLPEELKKYQEDFDQRLLGIFAMYSELYGRQALSKLLKRID